MGDVLVREERPGDVPAIEALVAAAFAGHPHSQGREAAIIAELRRRHALVLGLVAEDPGGDVPQVIGHVAFSSVVLEGSTGGWYALGPLAVRPDRQRARAGSALVREGLRKLRGLGARGCVLLGDPGYYGRFGFGSRPGLRYGSTPQEVVLGLGFGAEQPEGEIVFHSAFYA